MTLLWLTICSAFADVPYFGRVVDGGSYCLATRSDDGSHCISSCYDEGFCNVYYVEITNVNNVAVCVPDVIYGTAGDNDVSLASPPIVTTKQIKQEMWDGIRSYWDENSPYWTWDEQSSNFRVVPIQEAFDSVEDYAYSCSPSLASEDDYFCEIDDAPVTGRCWAVLLAGYSSRYADTSRSFSLELKGVQTSPIAFKILGSQTNCDLLPNVRDGYICEYGYISPEYGSKTLGVDFLWVSNSYQYAQITPPSAGGADYGKIYLCFGGDERLEIAFNAPCAGEYILDGNFPYDYSYRLGNSDLEWITDTPGAVVRNMRPAVSAGASGSSAFTHLYQIQLEVDRPGPCVLKSPIANNVVYAAIPRERNKPAISYPGQLSTASDGTRYGWTTVTVRFAPANTNYVFVGTTAIEGCGTLSRGRVTPSKCWKQGETIRIEATPYDGYEFDHWEYSGELILPSSVDLHVATVEFLADAALCGDRTDNRRICLKAHFSESKKPAVPTSYLNALMERGAFPEVSDGEMLKGSLAKNGRNSVAECYVCGIDPASETQVFSSRIEMINGEPVITWDPELTAAEKLLRKYTIWGSTNLIEWVDVGESQKDDYRFFKVTVEMK